ncbi:MAG TPA: arylamine N-acetyltransferase [Streptosporangiaceae bacterium]|nr:arylamine N-acetyltransferase [Streptosporangiaceae bacterium]
MDDLALTAYLRRINSPGPARAADPAPAEAVRADADGIRTLHQAHLLTVPFENLSIHLGEDISLDESGLLDKIVTRRRGGFCYELNGAFALLLEALGARVERLSAKVNGASGLAPPFDHLALVVHATDGSGPWLADVGFGDHTTFPLHFDDRAEQADPGGVFRLADTSDGDIEVRRNGELLYVAERRDRALADFAPTCWWQQTWPQSHFRQSTICSLLTPDGRISLSGRTLIRTRGAARIEEELLTDEAVLTAYSEYFGITLDRVPQVT